MVFLNRPLSLSLIRRYKTTTTKKGKSHAQLLNEYFKENPHIGKHKGDIPSKYLALRRATVPDNLYLIDERVANASAALIIPHLSKNQFVCETNAGLGLIASALLERGFPFVSLYESCTEFRQHLAIQFSRNASRVKLFNKDIYMMHRFDYVDRQDKGDRVQQLLEDVPVKSWTSEPALTIIGPLPKINFIKFLFKSIVLQNHVVAHGRMQVFAFMRPSDYIKLSAGPQHNLHTYQKWSVLFQLFFEFELLEKFPREAFLPWQSQKVVKKKRYANEIDTGQMYFVRMYFKKDLPVSVENLLPLFAFVVQFFGTGKNRVIPTLEKWIPGSGLDVLAPKLKHDDYFNDFSIFTCFGELNPKQFLAVFREMISSSSYSRSHFMAIIESQLVKSETTESSADDLEAQIVSNLDHLENVADVEHSKSGPQQ